MVRPCPCPVSVGVTLPAFIGAPTGSPAPVRERDARGNGGGFCTIRSLPSACRRRVAPLLVQFPPFAGGEVAIRGDVGTTAPGLVCRSHANPLLRALTGYIARKPAISRLGGAAHAHISGLTCALAGPCANQRAHARIRGPACVRAHILGAVSHAIRLSELSTVSTNVAIPTMRMSNATQGRGNCMRHSSIARPMGVMRCRRRRRRWRRRWRRQWRRRWPTRGLAWWAPSALANCPLNPSVHTRPRVRPHNRHVGAFKPHDETIPFNMGFPLPTQRKIPTQPTRYVLQPRYSARPVARGRQGGHHRNSASS